MINEIEKKKYIEIMMKNNTIYKKNNSKKLIIAFSSFDLYRKDNNKFDFFSLTNRIDIDVLLVRDLNNTWFFFPGSNMEGSEDHIAFTSEIVKIASGYDKVICIGSSMGGFASIYFGAKIPNCSVISFSPQINIDVNFLDSYGDFRQRHEISIVNNHIWDKKLLDIRFIENPLDTRFFIFFGHNDKIDCKYVSEMRSNPIFEVINLPYVNHGLIHALNASGIISEILDNMIIDDKIIDITEKIKQFKEDISHDLYLKMPIIYSHKQNKLRFTFGLYLKNEDFWINNSDLRVFVSFFNEKINRTLLNNFYFLPKQRLINGYIEHTIEIDVSSLEDGFHSCEVSLYFKKLSAIDIGSTVTYFQFDKFGSICPVSIIRSGELKAKPMIKEELFFIE